MEDLLKLHQPWDCERFPKSKTICYGGGGGGGGGGNPVKKVTKAVSSVTPTIKVETPKVPSVTDIKQGVSSTIESVKSDVARSDLGSGAIEEAVKRSDLGIISNQAKDVLNAPGAYIGKKAEEFKQYAKGQIFGGDKGGGDSGSSAASTSGQGPGQFATIGAGSQEGMKGTGIMKSGRQRARQNKRALRIASR